MARVQSNGIEIEYDVFGDAGPTLLLIMGIGSQMIFWDEELCQRFAEQGLRVVRFDHRDIGLSTFFDHAGKPKIGSLFARAAVGQRVSAPYTLSDMALDTVGLIDALELGRVHAMGVSMGGMIAQLMAIEHSERVASLTSIMSTTGERRYALSQPRAIAALLKPRPYSTPEEAGDAAVELFQVIGSPGFDLDEERLRRLAALAFGRSVHPEGFARHFAAILASGNRRKTLAQITAPSLVLHGEEDPLIPIAAGRATARAIPDAGFHAWEGMGHNLPQAIWPELVERVVEHVRRAEDE